MTFIAVYVTHSNEEEAKKIWDLLLDKKIIACYNLFPISAFYWWNWSIANANEIVSLLKTNKENWELLKSEVKKIHPYKIPCIMKFEVEANEDYEEWIQWETKG